MRANAEKALTGSCKLTEFKLNNSSQTYTMDCGAMTIRNESTFHGGSSFETTVTRTADGVVKVAHMKGRRTGDCKAGDR